MSLALKHETVVRDMPPPRFVLRGGFRSMTVLFWFRFRKCLWDCELLPLYPSPGVVRRPRALTCALHVPSSLTGNSDADDSWATWARRVALSRFGLTVLTVPGYASATRASSTRTTIPPTSFVCEPGTCTRRV